MNVNKNITNLEYDNELNKRLENRNVPSGQLDVLLDFRPLSTKYTLFHTSDSEQITTTQYHNQNQNQSYFNPGNRGPVNSFMKNVDIETKLRSQYNLENKPEKAFVPELHSQLYEYKMAYSPEYFSPTDAITLNQKCVNKTELPFYNCIKSESKK
jgi:hypothetical protein